MDKRRKHSVISQLMLAGVLIIAPAEAFGKTREKPLFSDGSSRYAGGVGAAGEEGLDLGIWEPGDETETAPEETEFIAGDETEYIPETIELGEKIFLDAPEGWWFDDSGASIYQQAILCTDDSQITVSILQNTSLVHEVEKEVQSTRGKIKGIVADKELQAGTRSARYLETHAIRGDYEFYYYIGLMEVDGELIKYNAVTTEYSDRMEERIQEVMSGTYYAYWQ